MTFSGPGRTEHHKDGLAEVLLGLLDTRNEFVVDVIDGRCYVGVSSIGDRFRVVVDRVSFRAQTILFLGQCEVGFDACLGHPGVVEGEDQPAAWFGDPV